MSEEKETNKINNLSFKTKIVNNENVLLLLIEVANNKFVMKITDTDAIGDGLYKEEWTKEEFQKIHRCFKMFENINEIFEQIKTLIQKKQYLINFDENSTILKFTLDAIIFEKENIDLNLKRAEMSEKDIIGQLCEKVKLLNIKCNQSNKSQLLNKLNSNIILNEDEYNMINDFIQEKIKLKVLEWKKIFTATKDGDTAENFHAKCDGIEYTVVLVKTKRYKRFGGFTKNKWNHNNGGYSNDPKTFLFSLTTMDIFNRNDNGNETQGNKAYGPWFGSGPDFQIADKCFTVNSTQNKKCFNYPQNELYPLAESSNFLVKEYEVYKVEFEPKSK